MSDAAEIAYRVRRAYARADWGKRVHMAEEKFDELRQGACRAAARA